jgi:hypothetical protein
MCRKALKLLLPFLLLTALPCYAIILVGFGTPVIDDFYSESNYVSPIDGGLRSDAATLMGQSFTSTGGTLDNIKWYVKKYTGSPTGNATAKVYAHSGTYGTSGVPTGSALATSTGVDVSAWSTSYSLVTFNFTGAGRITLTNGTHYVAVLAYSGGNGSNLISYGMDNTPAHSGNMSEYVSSWRYSDSWLTNKDVPFYVYVVK